MERVTGDTNVTVENHGGFPATFNVTAYANTTAFASANISLTIGSSDIITLSLSTSTFAYGNYTIKAIADTVPGETDTADNTYISVIQVHVGVPGDVSGPTQGVYDNTVNMRDIQYMILLFNAKPGSTNWNPNADVNNDAVVNMRDIQYMILLFNAKPGSTNWNPNADVNNDAVVNMRDINIAILNFNKHE